MKILDVVREVRRHLEENGRVSLRMLRRQYELDDEALDELIEELVDVQRVARREEKVLVWAGGVKQGVTGSGSGTPTPNPVTPGPFSSGESRKVISILFADLMGSTALQERLDPESVNRVMDAYYQAVRGPVEAAGGKVVQLLGDGVLCAFGIPTIAEDDALRAVRAAVGIQQAFREFLGTQQWLSVPIGLRVAVNTGEVVVSDEHPAGIGDPLNVAARLQQEARDGEVLIGQTTRRLVADAVTLVQAGAFVLKGRAETVTAYRVLSLERPTGTAAAGFVGREQELARITAAYEAAVTAPAARLTVLVASPGLGKSRLIDEISGRLGDTATFVTAHCDAVGGATFAPVAEALRGWIDRTHGTDTTDGSPAIALEAIIPESPERARIIAGITALLAGSPSSPEETFFVIRRFLTALAQHKPVVLVIDDLHWAEPLLLDLVEHLIQWGSGVPLFVLIGARPELRDLRSSLVTPGGLVSDVLTLSGLDAGAAMRLAANVIGASDLPVAVAAKVLATSEGNPLFVAELVRMLVDEGAIERQGERWVVGANLAALEMPPTIHALLAARIERLRPEERIVLERAAVVGRHFSRGAVSALLGRNGSELDALLEALRRSELIERDSGWFLGDPVLRFHHVLIRDAAYRRLLKGTRAELHERLAEWIEARAGDVAEHDETIGWHLEQAHQLLRELGPIDPAGRVLGERAARHLAVAGRRALGRDDLPVAADLLGRAINCLAADDAARADLALDWCEALLAAGDVGIAAKAIHELGRFIGDEKDQQDTKDDKDARHRTLDAADTRHPTPNARLRAWHTCFSSQLTVLTAPQGLQSAADAVGEAAGQLAALGDAPGEAKAHSVHAQALARLGKVGACEAALDQALAAARKAGDRRRANAVLAGAPLAALWGPSPVTRASGRCLDVVRVLRITQGAPAVESVALSCQGVLEALRGRSEAARRMLASARKMVEDLGIAHRLFETDAFAGRIAAMVGDAAGAEQLLRSAYEGLRELGLGIDAARAGALLARVLLARDRSADAEALSYESEALAGDDLQAAIAWRGVRAEALAKRGEHAAAVELAQAGVAIASATDALLDHADARVALAVALRAAGRATDADAEERRAIELWDAKGATLLADGARRRGATEPKNDRPSLPKGDHREVEPPDGSPSGPRLAKEGGPSRRVQPNAATAMLARLHAHLAARDFDAAAELSRADVKSIDHPSGSSYGREAIVASLRRFFRSRDPHYEAEPLATLGDFLVLARRRTRASGGGGGRYDVGAYENDALELFEVDESGKTSRTEVFAADHLGDAIARLYERYAELLPEGPERERATATARSFGAILISPSDIDGYAAVITPDFDSVDHRHLSTWSMRGGGAFLAHFRALQEVAADFVICTLDVLALAPGALLIQRMHSGTARLGGGAYERPFLVLFATDAGGRLARAEWFDSDGGAEALACFDALVAGGAAKRPVRRRVRPNAGTAIQERFEAALAARDFDGVAAVFDASHQEIDHPTGSTYGRDACIASLQRLFRSRQPHYDVERLATLGEGLLLVRRRWGATAATSGNYDVGAYENEAIQLFEANRAGLCIRSEVFAGDKLGAAIARLYQRHAELLPDGPLPKRSVAQAAQERERAAATARSVAVLAATFDLDRVATVIAPAIDVVDHRTVGFGTVQGAEEFIAVVRAMVELSERIDWRIDDVMGLRTNALLVRNIRTGIQRNGGGEFEIALCELWLFGADGLITRFERFDADREAEALVRFDDLVGRDPSVSSLGDGGIEEKLPSEPFANTASRAVERNARCWAARDWDGVLAILSSSLRYDDRRRLMRLEIGYEDFVVQFRLLFDQPASRWRETLIATRGERLALTRTNFEAEVKGGGGPLAFDEHLGLIEVDADGRWIACVTFDLEDLDAAHAELDARFEAGEAATFPHVLRALGIARLVRARDWPAWVAAQAPGFLYRDHRQLGFGNTVGDADALLGLLQSTFDLAPDAHYRDAHVRISARGILRQTALVGTRDGGAFENPMFLVFEVDELGRNSRSDSYDIGDRKRALARFAELAGSEADPASNRFENAASRAWREVIATWRQRDLGRFAARQASPLRYRDRRRLFQLDLDREGFLEFTRPLLSMRSASAALELLATRGERLALMRFTLEMEDEVVGPSAIDSLLLIETDECGAIVAYDRYEIDDDEAARAEIQSRWESGEGSQCPTVAWMRRHSALVERRDWDAVAALYSPAIVGHDHRLVGWGTLRGRTDFLQSLRSMEALSPDARMRGDHARACTRGSIMSNMWVGTRDGGAFESPFLVVSELDADGMVVRADFYDPHHFERAWARFEEIAAEPNPPAPSPATHEGGRGSLSVPKPNAATAAMEFLWAAFDALDLDAARWHFAPDFLWEDRRPIVGLSGGLDLMIASARERIASGARHQRRTIVGTAGDRVAVGRVLWAGGPPDGRFEVEFLTVHEVNEAGLCTALIFLDPDDERAAQREAWARWAAVDPVAAPWVELLTEIIDAWNSHDRARLRACFTNEIIVEDHRHTGLGRIEGADAYVDSNAVLWELAPDQRLEVSWSWPAVDRHGLVVTQRRVGTLADGGAFESEYVWLALARGGRVTRVELFEIDALDTALARFEELRPDPLRIPPNQATCVQDRNMVLAASGDWEGVQALHSPRLVFDDRRRGLRTTADGDAYRAGMRWAASPPPETMHTVLATAGDRLELRFNRFTRMDEGTLLFEVETLALAEIDADGRLESIVLFDPDDRGAAEIELEKRYLRLTRPEVLEAIEARRDAARSGDLARLRALMPDDFFFRDHRRTGLGSIEGAAAYVESLEALLELSRDATVGRPLYYLADEPHGTLSIAHSFGTLAEGGAFESVYAMITLWGPADMLGAELFEIEDLEAAKARFEALRAASSR